MSPYIKEFLFGAARTLDINSALTSKSTSRIFYNDELALVSDWGAVGSDLKTALGPYEIQDDEKQ